MRPSGVVVVGSELRGNMDAYMIFHYHRVEWRPIYESIEPDLFVSLRIGPPFPFNNAFSYVSPCKFTASMWTIEESGKMHKTAKSVLRMFALPQWPPRPQVRGSPAGGIEYIKARASDIIGSKVTADDLAGK